MRACYAALRMQESVRQYAEDVSGIVGIPICGEAGPQGSYFWLAGLVVRVHAACDAPGRPPPDVVRVAYPLEG